MNCLGILICGIMISFGQAIVPTFDSNATTSDIISLLRKNSRHIAERPGEELRRADAVNVSIYIASVREVSEIKSEIVYDMYFRCLWNDPRLQYNGGPQQIILKPDVAQSYFWFPDLFFSNSHDVMIHEMRGPNSAVRLQRTGDILVSARLSLTAHCDMDLSFFPRDTQICGFEIESYMYTSDELKLNWTAFTISSDGTPTNFQLMDSKRSMVMQVLSTGKYVKAQVQLTLKRMSSHYIALLYVPSGLLVCLSCLVFWFPPYALMERTFYGIFLLFSMVPMMVGSQYGSPAVGYLKAMDIWVVSHFFFLAMAVLEVLLLHLIFGRDLLAGGRKGDQFELMREEEGAKETPGVKLGPITIVPDVAKKIDYALRAIYPAAYVIFNAVYWAKY